jgi:putative copper resistance protein D
MAVDGLVAAAYLLGVRRLAARGRRWPRWRTASFLGGVLVLVIAMQSGLASLDDVFAVHNVQHVALMMLAPPLLVGGAPLALGLAAGGPILRQTILPVVRDPSMHLADGRFGIVALALDYYGVMFVYLLSPWFRIATQHPIGHELGHLYFFGCGLVFWHGLIGTSTRRWRRSPRSILTTVALGAPAMAALGLAVALRGPAIAPGLSGTDVADGAVALALGGAFATGIGLTVTAAELRRRRARGPIVTKPPARTDATMNASVARPGLTHAPSS